MAQLLCNNIPVYNPSKSYPRQISEKFACKIQIECVKFLSLFHAFRLPSHTLGRKKTIKRFRTPLATFRARQIFLVFFFFFYQCPFLNFKRTPANRKQAAWKMYHKKLNQQKFLDDQRAQHWIPIYNQWWALTS